MTRGLLSGWGRYPAVECEQKAARSIKEASKCIAENPQLIARGMGRSYGDASLNRDCTLMMGALDRMESFDELTGVLTCESGVLLADILNVFVPRGWFPPVTPGTKYVTVGGMIAADVHGKNHHAAGSFCDYVEWIELLRADGKSIICSKTQEPQLFEATRGGMGLTGVIVRAAFRLILIETSYIRQETKRAQNLAEILEQFEASSHWTYSAAWIDCLAAGASTGRSLLYLGEHARAEECARIPPGMRLLPGRKKTITVPPVFPSFAINRFSVRAFNALYYARGREGGSLVHYDEFFYPLDALLLWNRMYGKKGFVQYQCVLPKAAGPAGIRLLLEAIAREGAGSFLAVLKLLGKQAGLMSFPMEGYTLALDFPAGPPSFNLLERLDAIVADHGGRIYLAKDARATPAFIRQGYPKLSAFEAVRGTDNAKTKFNSLLSERVAL